MLHSHTPAAVASSPTSTPRPARMWTSAGPCRAMPGLCQGGSYLNTVGSFECCCPAGHRLDDGGTTCEDLDECLSRPGPYTGGD
ncbi:fibulin-1 [Oryctolagus cuniculus]|uniref:fibulin-1 n=1 Tax=Oryctolagus cuniculus TaxID=9986 RepID=UPI0038793C45